MAMNEEYPSFSEVECPSILFYLSMKTAIYLIEFFVPLKPLRRGFLKPKNLLRGQMHSKFQAF